MYIAARTSARAWLPALLAGLLLTVGACAPEPGSSGGSGGSPGKGASAPADGASCAKAALATKVRGKLTVGTDKPAYAPWFKDDTPANGEGFESAVAYAVAGSLGFGKDQVSWQTVPFNSSFAPGEKHFDFDINQVSISDSRRQAVDFSSGYYTVRQAIVTLKKSRFAHVTSIAGLKDARIGAQVGTTSLDAVDDLIKPVHKPAIYQKSDFVKEALRNGQVDAVVLDLPTAFYITSAEIPEATITGQFADTSGKAEEFGLVLDKGSALTACVTRAVDGLRRSGTLAALEKKWLADTAAVPVLT